MSSIKYEYMFTLGTVAFECFKYILLVLKSGKQHKYTKNEFGNDSMKNKGFMNIQKLKLAKTLNFTFFGNF